MCDLFDISGNHRNDYSLLREVSVIDKIAKTRYFIFDLRNPSGLFIYGRSNKSCFIFNSQRNSFLAHKYFSFDKAFFVIFLF